MDQRTPYFSDQQIDYLDRVFPNRCARAGMSDQEIWMEAGSRKVIEHLRSIRANGDQIVDEAQLIRAHAPKKRKR